MARLRGAIEQPPCIFGVSRSARGLGGEGERSGAGSAAVALEDEGEALSCPGGPAALEISNGLIVERLAEGIDGTGHRAEK
jgi:hypothetical protein